MIKILELIDGGFIGGGQTHILSLANCIDKESFNLTIAASGKGEFKKMSTDRGYNFKEIELPKIYRSKYLKDLDRIIKENSIDIIHSHGGVAGMYARFYRKKYNSVKVIHTIHGIHYINSPNVLKKIITLSVEQYLVPFTDKFVCVSDADFETALKNKIINPDKTIVIKNGIDTEKFSRKAKDQELSKELNIGAKDFIIGNVSRFDYQKNQRFILSNTKSIFEKNPDIKLILAGDGKLLRECREFSQKTEYKNRIIFTGEISNPEDYYSLFDIFIFPSMWEGLSISLIEAMASSNCIIASDIAANRELIKDNVNGFTFSLKDRDEFIRKLEVLIIDDKLRHRFSKQAYLDSLNYSEKEMTEKTEKEYLKLLKSES